MSRSSYHIHSKAALRMRPLTALLALVLFPSLVQATLYVNAAVDNATVATGGEGPLGADPNYVAYLSDHEDATSGALASYAGVSFAEGGLAGPYNVGVAFSWPDATTDATKQAFDRTNINSYDSFWETWVGIDTRVANGGIGGGDRLTLSLTGLPVNSDFVFTSYHFDTQNQPGTFLVNQTPTATETATSPFAFPRGDLDPNLTPWIDNVYSFDVASDGSGNLDITFTQNSGTWIGINGFDLVAIPEPSSAVLIGLGVLLLARRRRS